MTSKFNRKQILVIIGVPMAVLVVSWFLYMHAGARALLVPPVLIGVFVAYLIVEVRHYQLRLFMRQVTEIRSMYSQIEALIGITSTLDPQLPLPPTRGWSASPDLLREITEIVLTRSPELIVEASSGTSTVVIGHCLRRLGKGRVIALEHDRKYAERTIGTLKAHGLLEFATVVHAPLVDMDLNGQKARWYDLDRVDLSAAIDLLIVDGPPDTVARFARYPAVPLLYEHFKKGTQVLLDDGGRDDERLIAERWSNEFGADNIEYLPLEKGAWSLIFGERLFTSPTSPRSTH